MAHKIKTINASLVDLKSEASFIGLVSKKIDATPQGIAGDRETNSFLMKMKSWLEGRRICQR
ncbi:unnamed protein product [Prunus armeniaca]|uniref:Uncharacterized protein n=1 Tax=Prunus armeniaca TaxID=36596 RepID=A0A6J5TCV0_PRUAR|nr:unnamed protein product [Prunus armeniaca]